MIKPSLCCLALVASLGADAEAQKKLDPRRPFEIADNSFLVEEAFNQEAGVFQNIVVFRPPRDGLWTLEFTQEWPVGSQRHQLSFTAPLEAVRPAPGEDYVVTRGELALHYRYQLAVEEANGVAISPRLSLLVPRGEFSERWGLQLNLPFSRQLSDFYVHFNAGGTFSNVSSDAETQWHLAGSLIYRMLPMVHAMFETVYQTDALETADGRSDDWLLSPGVRAGINLGDHQLVLGLALPVGLRAENDTRHLFTYISYELPFMRR